MTPHTTTEAEVRQLLAIAMAYDHRKPGDAAVMAWLEAATRARWTFAEAREAILNHFATSTEYLMPGHVTAAIRATRSQPPPVKMLPASPLAPASPDRIREIIAVLARKLGWTDRPSSNHPALAVSCPHCGASVGRPCARQLARGHRRGQWVSIRTIHPSRITQLENQ